MTFLEDGLWCRLPAYVIPGEHGVQTIADVAFRIPTMLPRQAPTASGCQRQSHPAPDPALQITNYTYPVTTGFGEGWGQFSGVLKGWNPGPTARGGDNMVTWVGTFAHRLLQGP